MHNRNDIRWRLSRSTGLAATNPARKVKVFKSFMLLRCQERFRRSLSQINRKAGIVCRFIHRSGNVTDHWSTGSYESFIISAFVQLPWQMVFSIADSSVQGVIHWNRLSSLLRRCFGYTIAHPTENGLSWPFSLKMPHRRKAYELPVNRISVSKIPVSMPSRSGDCTWGPWQMHINILILQ
jgi:hypothetical protein